ncbi:chromatin structure-remodeling complex protein RSC7 [Blastomyces parvus]|uniref:Chromatin structure-remodeling complex protein RSC7 n=1 Tax=Blastomyces parvus TaxID=2060905 RepID=A0A2B7WPV4_9EURO|nr:chromatin structure-remodeling complex protein RSC7 [Blastomyces parvus]
MARKSSASIPMFIAAQTSPIPLRLPGFGIELNRARTWRATPAEGFVTNRRKKLEDDGLFPSLLALQTSEGDGATRRLAPIREFTMLQIMNTITDKPGWEKKIFSPDITKKWREEVMAHRDMDVSERMMDWVINELQARSKDFEASGNVLAYDAGVVKSDTAIPEPLRNALKSVAARLENVPDDEKDYHPHSDNQVLDLVHPSLFPVVFGRTRIITDGVLGIHEGIARAGSGEILKIPPKEDLAAIATSHYRSGGLRVPYSQKFQWLPCDVVFTTDSTVTDQHDKDKNRNSCKITSYINNLHPREHQELYEVIEQVISLAIPLWNRTLGAAVSEPYVRIEYEDSSDKELDHDFIAANPKPEMEPGEEEYEYEDRVAEWEEHSQKYILPEPRAEFVPPYEDIRVDLQEQYRSTGLQVIVKLANIHLTPEKPRYNGGTWHVEGQLNEHICATALYYYDSENITESRLAFRQLGGYDDAADIAYEQDEHGWLPLVFGCENGSPPLQEIGDVVCKEGRLLTFPNILQHRVSPFQLQDPSKPGHRKILALFLVDPNIRIISSANVPCQRRDWWAEQVPWESITGRLPPELSNEIVSHIDDFPISMEDAKELRLELMEERKAVVMEQDEAMESYTVSLCEH